MLLKALWYRKQVQVTKSIVLRHQSLSALIIISYITFDVSTQAFLIVAQSNKLERLSLPRYIVLSAV
jgi:hypothetical protein